MCLESIGVTIRGLTRPAGRIVFAFALCLLQAAAASAQLIISEFRLRGPNGANDEFVEIYNNSGAYHTVAGGGTGYALAASNGVARCVVPNGTIIPERGHYLCVNSVGYSLASYPAGNGTTATGDATYTTDIPDNAGHRALQHVGRCQTSRSPTGSTPWAPRARPTHCTRKAPAIRR